MEIALKMTIERDGETLDHWFTSKEQVERWISISGKDKSVAQMMFTMDCFLEAAFSEREVLKYLSKREGVLEKRLERFVTCNDFDFDVVNASIHVSEKFDGKLYGHIVCEYTRGD